MLQRTQRSLYHKGPAGLLEALGANQPVEVLRSRDYMLVYNTEAEILAFKPDFNALSKIDALGIIVTAQGDNSDFVSWFFCSFRR